MPNGDFIEGTFTGQWGDGIRVNGTFHKLETTGTTNRSSRYAAKQAFLSTGVQFTCQKKFNCRLIMFFKSWLT